MNIFFNVFSPIKIFNKLKIEKLSLTSLMIISLLILINLILTIPISEKIFQLTISSMVLSEGQLDSIVQFNHKMRYWQIAGMEILNVLMLLFYAFLLYLLIRIVKNKLKYKKVFQIFICCYTVTVMGDLINTIIIYIRGLDNIKNIYDTSLTGLNLLTSIELIGIVPYISLGYVNPFQIGFLILLSVGLKTVIDIKQVEAMIISVLFWLIIVLIPTLSVYFSLIT